MPTWHNLGDHACVRCHEAVYGTLSLNLTRPLSTHPPSPTQRIWHRDSVLGSMAKHLQVDSSSCISTASFLGGHGWCWSSRCIMVIWSRNLGQSCMLQWLCIVLAQTALGEDAATLLLVGSGAWNELVLQNSGRLGLLTAWATPIKMQHCALGLYMCPTSMRRSSTGCCMWFEFLTVHVHCHLELR